MAKDDRFTKILAATDGSKESMAAVNKAIRLAINDDAELIILNVLQLPVVNQYTAAMISSALEKGVAEAEGWLKDIKKKAEADVRTAKTVIVRSFDSTASEIVTYAEKENIDLIVMGTRGRSKLKKMILGSTASGVVMNASCTVMIVR